MIEEIRDSLFRIEIPLPDNPLKHVNSYVIRSGDGSLIVDTGLNRDECHKAMLDGLGELGVTVKDCHFFITHLHADHFGLVSRLATDPGQVYFSRPESEIIESWTGWEPMIEYAAANGFPEDQLRAALASHPGFKYSSNWVPEMKVLSDGDAIEAGDYRFTCIETPGHTKGHICLHEPDSRLLLSGDHILGDITPNIQCWSDTENPLLRYLESLKKVSSLEAELVLPGHRSLVGDMAARIGELEHHHRKRLDEVLNILSDKPRHAFETASCMTWDLTGKWDRFPLAQKWFATAEATAHLRYLEDEGSIRRTLTSGKIIYALA